MDTIRNEPVLVSLAAALIALAVAFGVGLSADQQAAIMAVVVIVAGLITRSKVTPEVSAKIREETAAFRAYRDITANDSPAGETPEVD